MFFDGIEASAHEYGALSTTGPSGGIAIPDGKTLADGTVALGFNNAYDPRFYMARNAENYMFGMSVFPHVELSGKLTNFPADTWTGAVSRDLSANLKISIPQFFEQQPEIAFGMNDLGGGAQQFRSKYVAVSQSVGAMRATLGSARGEAYLNGFFAGVEYTLGDTGFSLLAERNGQVNLGGLRYASLPMTRLGNASLVVTAQRSSGLRAIDGSNLDRNIFGFNFVIPFGENARYDKTLQKSGDSQGTKPTLPVNLAEKTSVTPHVTPSNSAKAIIATEPSQPPRPQTLRRLQAELEKAGLERVRVANDSDSVIIEYENHRYNQNEVDALGIVLGLAANSAPESISQIRVIVKKAGLGLYEVRTGRQSYRRYLGDPTGATDDMLTVDYRPQTNEEVQWLEAAEGKRGYSRILIEPVLKKFIGTEYGLYDYSLAASIQGIVPLWKGAEFNAAYISNLSNSANMRSGIFDYGRQESGLKSAALNQSFWVADRVLNIFSAGKYQYTYYGMQNETTWFVPGRDDIARFQYTRINYNYEYGYTRLINMGAYYRFNYQPLNVSVEVGYNQYAGNDQGHSLQISRWFGDVQSHLYMRHSNLASYIGFQLSFPLTPRKGMSPGYTSVEGPAQFAYGAETLFAQPGSGNYIERGKAEVVPIFYSSDQFLLNQGRTGERYMNSQLPRLRDAFLLYTAGYQLYGDST